MSDVITDDLAHYLGRCALKDQKAFAKLYEISSGKVYAILLRMIKCKTLADEALQDCYIKVWKNASSYNSEKGEPITWLASIARYSALDLIRRQNTRDKYEQDYVQESEHDEDNEGSELMNPSKMMENDNHALTHCLDKLQPNAKETVVMAFCDGYTHEELSEKLNTPIGTIKSWIRRSLKRLQECINELSKA